AILRLASLLPGRLMLGNIRHVACGRQVSGSVRDASADESRLSFVALVARAAVSSAARRHAGQRELEGKIGVAGDELPLVPASKRRDDLDRALERAADQQAVVLEERRCRVGERVPVEGADRDSARTMDRAPDRGEPYQEQVAPGEIDLAVGGVVPGD